MEGNSHLSSVYVLYLPKLSLMCGAKDGEMNRMTHAA